MGGVHWALQTAEVGAFLPRLALKPAFCGFYSPVERTPPKKKVAAAVHDPDSFSGGNELWQVGGFLFSLSFKSKFCCNVWLSAVCHRDVAVS